MFGLNKEPAVIVGAVVTAISAAILSLAGSGILTQDAATSIVNVLGVLAPLIAGVLIRFKAYSPNTVAALTGTTVNTLPPPP